MCTAGKLAKAVSLGKILKVYLRKVDAIRRQWLLAPLLTVVVVVRVISGRHDRHGSLSALECLLRQVTDAFLVALVVVAHLNGCIHIGR